MRKPENGQMIKVAIAQARLHHFRVPFYQQLKGILATQGIELHLIYGPPSKAEQKKNDSAELEWATKTKNYILFLGHVELLWQPYLKHIRDCDVIIVQQENRMLMNYVLLIFRRLLGLKVAFWGHGINCQAVSPKGLKEKWKRLFLKSPDWWFAYTDFTKDILINTGYPAEQITLVQNAVDTSQLRKHAESITDDELNYLRVELGMNGASVGVYCGSLYVLKRIDFLVEAAKRIRAEVEDFELVIIGDGSDRAIAETGSQEHTWIHYVGTKYGREQAKYMKLGSVFLIPGGVGLAIVDSFLFGMPLFTTNCKGHGPEISYLEVGRNGYMTADNMDDYTQAVVRVLKDRDWLARLSENCKKDAEIHTIDNMARNFADGVVRLVS